MRHKLELQQGQQPKPLSASEIRIRVEDIAAELALKMCPDTGSDGAAATEAFPLDMSLFIRHMSEFIRMN